jgi:hypothetical protein
VFVDQLFQRREKTMKEISCLTRRLARHVWMAAVLLAALLLSAFVPAGVAQADTGFAYYWSLTFDFESNANGVLQVVVGHNEDGAPQEPALVVQNTSVPCRRVGNLTVSGGELKLNGGYLRCDLDVKNAVERAVALCKTRVPECSLTVSDNELYSHFRATAELLATNPGTAPLFYHPDAAYAIDVQSSTAQITGALTPHGVIPSTSVITAPGLGVMRSYEAFYSCEGGCDMDYFVGAAQETVVTANAQVSLYTPATTVYVGYNPASGLVAPAGTHIASLVVDPPNHGND